MPRIRSLVAILSIATFASGCDVAGPTSPTPIRVEESAPGSLPGAVQWVDSDDGLVALRLLVPSRKLAADSPIQVTAQLRNTGQSPITVLRPFGDSYVAKAVGMKIWDDQSRIRYTGPNVTYVIGANAFAVVGPGETIEDQLELTIDNFAGIEAPGTYTLRYDYSYDGQWDATAARGNSGIRDAWRGTISSREVQLLRE